MGNYKFRLSDMMPNAWFYKLKDMGSIKPKNQKKKKKNKKNPTLPSSSSPSTTTTALSLSSSSSSKTKQQQQQQQPHHQCRSRKSYYFTRELTTNDERFSSSPSNSPKNPNTHFLDPSGKSSKQRLRRRKPTTKSSPKFLVTTSSSGFSCKATLESVCTKPNSPPEISPESSSPPFDSSPEKEISGDPEFRCDRILATQTFDGMVSLSSAANTCRSEEEDCKENDIVIDVDKVSLSRKTDSLDGFHSFPEIELPPIITKPSKPKRRSKNGSVPVKVLEEQRMSSVRRFSVNSPGVRLRINSPRIAGKRVSGNSRKSVSSGSNSGDRKRSLTDSFAIVKSSFDPQKDFRESMVEMIIENNIRASKDLEDLLACYLSLNSDEYHDLIIKVFKQIWFDLTDISSK